MTYDNISETPKETVKRIIDNNQNLQRRETGFSFLKKWIGPPMEKQK